MIEKDREGCDAVSRMFTSNSEDLGSNASINNFNKDKLFYIKCWKDENEVK